MSNSDIIDKVKVVLKQSAASAMLNDSVLLNAYTQCESPIERLFLIAAWSRGCWCGDLQLVADASLETLREAALNAPLCAAGMRRTYFAPQVVFGRYRLDFLFAFVPIGQSRISLFAIECDGHDFHEKTKQQAQRDKARDRDLVTSGVTVVRFTGSEIWADAGACAEQAIKIIWKGLGPDLEDNHGFKVLADGLP